MANHFVITIARGYGSGGKTIGKMLSQELGIPFYDRELLYLASEESGIKLEMFGDLDEKLHKSFLDKRTHKYVGDLIPPESSSFVSDENLFNYQAKIIKDLADKESCIIVGRCADFILKDRENVVKTFIWAPEVDCIKTVMSLQSLSEKDAERKIKKIDRHRRDHYHYYTCRDWDDYQNYDLCLNSSSLGYDKCTQLIKAFTEIKLNIQL